MSGRKAQKQRRNQAKRARVEENKARRKARTFMRSRSPEFHPAARLAKILEGAREFRRRVMAPDWPLSPAIHEHWKASARGYLTAAQAWREEAGPAPLP